MKPKGYKRTRWEKRTMGKCTDGVARTYNALESKYVEMLQENPDIKEFRCQVLLEGLEIGEYCSDFVATKVRETMSFIERQEMPCASVKAISLCHVSYRKIFTSG